jgi:hypothetical protein
VGALASAAAEDRDARSIVQERCQLFELPLSRPYPGRGRQQTRGLGERRIVSGQQCDVARDRDDRDATLTDCFANGHFQRARHLVWTRDELAVVAALFEERLRMGLLEVAAADLRGWNLRRNCQDRHPRAVGIEQPIDQMQVAGSATAGADGEITRELRLRSRCKRRHLLVSHMDPLDVAATAYDIGKPIQAVADDAIDAFHAGGHQRLDELICNSLRHVQYSLKLRLRFCIR